MLGLKNKSAFWKRLSRTTWRSVRGRMIALLGVYFAFS